MAKFTFQPKPQEEASQEPPIPQETLQGGPGVPPGEPVEGAEVPKNQPPPLTIGEFGPIINWIYLPPKREPFDHPDLSPYVQAIISLKQGESGFFKGEEGLYFYKEGKNIELVPNPQMIPEGVKVQDLKGSSK